MNTIYNKLIITDREVCNVPTAEQTLGWVVGWTTTPRLTLGFTYFPTKELQQRFLTWGVWTPWGSMIIFQAACELE